MNLGGKLFVETVTRRISTITEALERGPLQATRSQAREIMGRSRADSFLSQDRRAEMSRFTERRLVIENLRIRSVSHPSCVDVSADDVSEAVVVAQLHWHF